MAVNVSLLNISLNGVYIPKPFSLFKGSELHLFFFATTGTKACLAFLNCCVQNWIKGILMSLSAPSG